MFLGQYERSLDRQGRLVIPAAFRAGLGKSAVLTRSFDTCLWIYPAATWSVLARAVDDLPQVRFEVCSSAHSLSESATPCTFDRQGRLAVPLFLREQSGIYGDVLLVGACSRIEVWDRDLWLELRRSYEHEDARLAEALAVSTA